MKIDGTKRFRLNFENYWRYRSFDKEIYIVNIHFDRYWVSIIILNFEVQLEWNF
jgi:hypothetical protein